MKKSYIKGFLEDMVIHLVKDQGETYGYEITRKVEEITEGVIKINEGALYPILHKLVNNGVLESYFKIPDNGRPRKYYKLAEGNGNVHDMNLNSAKEFIKALQLVFNSETKTST